MMDQKLPRWSREKLRRYDAAWARVFASETTPPPSSWRTPEREASALLREERICAEIYLRLARALPARRNLFQTLARQKQAQAQRLLRFLRTTYGGVPPTAGPEPGRLSPDQRIRHQLHREQELARRYQTGSPLPAALSHAGSTLALEAAETLSTLI